MPLFYHISDLHLGNVFANVPRKLRARLQQAQMETLRGILRFAREEGVQCVLISGDLFDSNLVSQGLVEQVQEMFGESKLSILILPGSGDVTDRRPHDALLEPSVYDRPGWRELHNVSIFRDTEKGQVFLTEDGLTSVYGKPVIRKGESPIPEIPLNDTKYHIVMLHGDSVEMAYLPDPDYPISLEDIKRRGYQYAALGHWHSFAVFPKGHRKGDFLAVYPGTPQDLSFKEASGYAIKVSLEDTVTIEPIRHSALSFVTIQAFPEDTPEATLENIIKRIPEPRETLLQVVLEGPLPLGEEEAFLSELEELLRDSILHVKIGDKTFPELTEEVLNQIGEKSILGNLLMRLRDMGKGSSIEEREVQKRAMQYGYSLLQGKTTPKDLELASVLRKKFYEDS